MPNKHQRTLIFNKLGYKPSGEQDAVHDCPARIRLVAGGERAGKSKLSAMDLMGRFYEGSLYWLVAADYERTRAEFDYICNGFEKLHWNYEATKQVDPGEILAEGGFRFVTKSAKDPRKLAVEAPDGILVCEASQIDWETYLRLRGRLAEKRGWMLLSGTFESSLGWYVDQWQLGQLATAEFASFSLPTWSNLAIFPGGRSDAEILSLEHDYSTEWFQERFGGVPSPPKGLVFHEFKVPIHVGTEREWQLQYDEPIYLFIDPGFAHAYAIEAAVLRDDQIVIVDEIYERGLVTSDMITLAKQKSWWGRVKGGAIDVAALQHQAMPAVAEIWMKEARINLRHQKVRIQDGIERMKSFLKVNPLTNKPGLLINARCKGLISELGGCPNPLDGSTRVYKWRMSKDGLVAGDAPEDKNNDAIKATIYGIVDLKGYSSTATRKPLIKFW